MKHLFICTFFLFVCNTSFSQERHSSATLKEKVFFCITLSKIHNGNEGFEGHPHPPQYVNMEKCLSDQSIETLSHSGNFFLIRGNLELFYPSEPDTRVNSIFCRFIFLKLNTNFEVISSPNCML